MKRTLLAAGMAVGLCAMAGCPGGHGAVKKIEKQVCDAQTAPGAVYTDTYAAFSARMTFSKEMATVAGVSTEDEFIAWKKNKFKELKSDSLSFSACEAKTEWMACKDVYSDIAKEGPEGLMGESHEKRIAAIGKKMGISDCGVITVTRTVKGKTVRETIYVGRVGQAVQTFFSSHGAL